MNQHAAHRRIAQAPSARWLWFFAFLVVLLAVYSPTLVYPYLLMDETWLVTPGTHTWTYHLGRPIFTVMAWATARLASHAGLDVAIYAMRLFAIVFLALSCVYLTKWLRLWGHSEIESAALAVAAMTLPAMQIVVADGTQLAAAIFLTVFATHLWFTDHQRSPLVRHALAGALLLAALLIYQQQILFALAMLCVPLLAKPDSRVHRAVIGYTVLIAAVCAGFFAVWKATYRWLLGGRVDFRYGPDAVQLPTMEQVWAFIDVRLVQVANLWKVDPPAPNWVIFVVVALALAKMASDLWKAPRSAPISYALLLGVLVGTDSIAIAARAYPSYITATGLTFVVFYWAVSGARVAIGPWSRPGAIAIAAIGGLLAFVTVKDGLAVANWAHMQTIRQALLANPKAVDFHFVGMTAGGPRYQEFGWRNAGTDGYIMFAVNSIADDLVRGGLVRAERRKALTISIEGVAVWAYPEKTRHPKKPDAIAVPLNGRP